MPEPVTGFDIETADEYSITLIWKAPEHEIDYFEITVSEDDTGRKISTSKLPSSKTVLVIQDLESATRYKMAIWTVVDGRKSLKRSKLVNTAIRPPKNIIITNITDISAHIQWAEIDKSVSTTIILQERQDKRQKNKKVFSVKKGENRYLMKPIYPGTSYIVEVQHHQERLSGLRIVSAPNSGS